jgi:hypothetical protein
MTGSPFRVDGCHLRIGSNFILDLTGSFPWSEPSIDPLHVLSSSELPAQIDSFFSKLDLSNAKGFGQFIPEILSVSRNQTSFSAPTDPILAFAHPRVMNLAYACLHHQLDKISRNADMLIGLGSGLTPSGDDFIGGLLFAHHVLRTKYPNRAFDALKMTVETYRSRTHAISFTLLKDLTDGHAIEPLHQIINGLLYGKSIESIYPFFSQLTQVGNSTGWDMLAGFLTGLLIAYSSSSIPLRMYQSMEV